MKEFKPGWSKKIPKGYQPWSLNGFAKNGRWLLMSHLVVPFLPFTTYQLMKILTELGSKTVSMDGRGVITNGMWSSVEMLMNTAFAIRIKISLPDVIWGDRSRLNTKPTKTTAVEYFPGSIKTVPVYNEAKQSDLGSLIVSEPTTAD